MMRYTLSPIFTSTTETTICPTFRGINLCFAAGIFSFDAVEAVEHNGATLEDAIVAVRAGERLRFKKKRMAKKDSSDEISHSNVKLN